MARFGARTPLLQRRKVIASWTAMSVFAAGLTVYAISQRGYPVLHAALNDGGIWVTNPSVGLGRENRALGQLDATVPVCQSTECNSGQYDVLQNGSAVFQMMNGLTPVDVASGSADPANFVGFAGVASLGGTTLATLDRSGGLRAVTVDPDTGAANMGPLAASTKPIARQRAGGVLSTGTDGTAYMAVGDALTTLAPTSSGFGKPTTTSLNPALGPNIGALGQSTVVGSTFVYAAGPASIAVDGKTVDVGPGGVLQQPSAKNDRAGSARVLVGAPTGLKEVDLGTGNVTTIAPQVSGLPSQPVQLGECVFGTWYQVGNGSTGTEVSQCNGGEVQTAVMLTNKAAGSNCLATGISPLRLRVNHNSVVVNNVCNGEVWPMGSKQVRPISDWDSHPKIKPHNDSKDPTVTPDQHPKPKAKDDTLGVRAGSQTILHVLDNDSAAKGALLEISKKTDPSLRGVSVAIAPDRQTLLASATRDLGGQTTTFQYTIDDGKGATSSATVTLHIRGTSEPAVAPKLAHQGTALPTYSVAVGGTVAIPVSDAWRDETNGDQIAITSVGGDGVSVSPEGMLAYTPPDGARGRQTFTYSVGTSPSATSSAQATINVLGAGDQAQAPDPQPDVVQGVMVNNNPAVITIHPLANDLPGADPSDPNAPIKLGTSVRGTGDAPLATADPTSGTIQLTATRAGSFDYSYGARQGGSGEAVGQLRVIVVSGSSAVPVAVPDQSTLYATQPKTVDVLANDFDPLGRVMVVTSASTDAPGLQVGVIDNHWLRVVETDSLQVGTTATVHYSMSVGNGAGDEGTLKVRINAESVAEDQPVAVDDHVVVRSGDSVLVPVLDNDTVPSGAPLGLDRALVEMHGCPDSAGGIQVNSNDGCPLGMANIVGNSIRYRAPAGLTSPISVQIPYTVINQAVPKAKDGGRLFIQVNPAPVPVSSDQAPTPQAVESRVIQGDTVTIKLPASGMDPDGDSVSLTGIGDPTSAAPGSTVPHLGTVLAYGGNSITYQAFPKSSGTDTFSYVVTDGYGQSAAGTVRVGVVPADAAQQPVPVADAVTVDPSRTLTFNVLANDIKPPGTTLTMAPFSSTLAGVSADVASGLVTVQGHKFPDGQTIGIPYALNGPVGPTATAQLNVTFKAGYDNPPLAGSAVATTSPGAHSVKVDLNSKVSDVDDASGLTIGQVHDPSGAKADISNGVATLPLGNAPEVWTYQVTDPAGAAATGTIYVPALDAGGPYLKPGSEIQLSPSSSTTINLAQFVLDSRGKKVQLTDGDSITGAPDGSITKGATSATSIKITAGQTVGVGTLSFQVTDGSTATSADGVRAMISIPVVIGNPKPVIACPSSPISVYDHGEAIGVNVAQYCHVWTQDPNQAATLTYDASSPTRGVSVSGGSPRITLSAKGAMGNCATNATPVPGTVKVSSAGSSSSIALTIRCLPPAQFITPNPYATTTKSGPLTIDLTNNIFTHMRLQDLKKTVTKVTPVDKAPHTLTVRNGAVLTFTPPTDQHGRFKYDLQLNDAGSDPSRAIHGQIEIDVAGVPDAPVAVAWRHSVPSDLLSRALFITFKHGNSDGDDPRGVDHYEVSVDRGGPQNFVCQASPCQVTGVPNGQHTVTVVAVNSVGASAKSTGVPAYAGTIAGSVQGLKVKSVAPHTVTLAWTPPLCVSQGKCGQPTGYDLAVSGVGIRHAPAGATSWPFTGLPSDGQSYTITVTANTTTSDALKSQVGFTVVSPTQIKDAWPSGPPSDPVWSAISQSTAAGSSSKPQVMLNWQAVADPNGRPGVTYIVTRDTPTGAIVCQTQSLNCPTWANGQGEKTTFYITAHNEGPKGTQSPAYGPFTSHAVAKTITVAGKPQGVTSATAHANGTDSQGSVTFDVGQSNGKRSDITCVLPGGGSCGGPWSIPSGAQNQTRTVTGLGNGSGTSRRSFSLIQTNEGSTGTTGADAPRSDPFAVTTNAYGPIPGQSISAGTGGGTVLTWNATIHADGKPVSWTVVDNAGHTWAGTTSENGADTYISNGGGTDLGNSTPWHVQLSVSDTTDQAGGPHRSAPAVADGGSGKTAPPTTVTPSDGGATGQATGNCTNRPNYCHYMQVTLDGAPGAYGYCSTTHSGAWRNGETWWYSVGPIDASGHTVFRIASNLSPGPNRPWLAYDIGSYPTWWNGCQAARPAGNLDTSHYGG